MQPKANIFSLKPYFFTLSAFLKRASGFYSSMRISFKRWCFHSSGTFWHLAVAVYHEYSKPCWIPRPRHQTWGWAFGKNAPPLPGCPALKLISNYNVRFGHRQWGWKQPVVKTESHCLWVCCVKKCAVLKWECFHVQLSHAVSSKVKKVIYLVFGWLSGQAPDFTGCNLILNCLATYTFHSQESNTHIGFSIRAEQICQSNITPKLYTCERSLCKCAC